jgi:GNAT superfamily N-acetyltransferase
VSIPAHADVSLETPRLASDTRRALPLFDRVFGAPGEPGELERECPLVFQGAFDGSVVAIEVDGEIASACAILRRDLVLGDHRVRAGFVGSVATDPRFRGRGLASRVLEAAEAELRKRGAWIACLWADDAPFYEQRGWRAFGAERDVVVSPALASKLPEPSGARPLSRDDVTAVHALYRRHTTRVDRTASETSALLDCPRMSVLVRERASAVVAYACMGRGRDLADVIHEWGGEAEDVAALVRAHVERRAALGDQSNAFLISPVDEMALASRLAELGAPNSTGILGLAKLLDARAAAEFAASLLGPTVRANREHPIELTELRGPRGTCSLSDAALIDVLFCARGERRVSNECAADLGVERGTLLLAPFAWGLDSI